MLASEQIGTSFFHALWMVYFPKPKPIGEKTLSLITLSAMILKRSDKIRCFQFFANVA